MHKTDCSESTLSLNEKAELLPPDYEQLFMDIQRAYHLSVTRGEELRRLLLYAASYTYASLEAEDSEHPSPFLAKSLRTVLFRKRFDPHGALLIEQLTKYLLSIQAAANAPVSPHRTSPLSSTLYVEEAVIKDEITRNLFSTLKSPVLVKIKHYKDIFRRQGNGVSSDPKDAPSLILAANHGTLFYPGAPVCQSFGEEHFLYTSCVMNCLYDCDYCYLHGMYPSGDIVVFVNLDDYFRELDRYLALHPVYLCVSYDSDLVALHGLLPHAKAFCDYAATHQTLRLELRTKCASQAFLRQLTPTKNVVLAFTLSPNDVVRRYEHFTAPLKERLLAAKEAARLGFSVRLCFDPLLDLPNAQTLYADLIDETFQVLTVDELTDVSVGVFRLPKQFRKQLRHAKPHSPFSHYPYEVTDGVCHYPMERANALLDTVVEGLLAHGLSESQIFVWSPKPSASPS